ncbi:hypothetical protein BGZ72_006933 [Mortierella alpina]|nr:hypothetical protein BGZ72_006933 [Mortierella alpina]
MPTAPPSPDHSAPVEATAAAAASKNTLYQSYQSQIENLKRLPVPYSDIYHALSSHDTIPLTTLHERFSKAATDLTTWLESAEMAVFALELDVGQEGATDKRDVGDMDVIMNRFQPNVDMLVELKEKIESRLKAATPAEQEEVESQQIEQDLKQTAAGIKSSWTSLKQMLEKVKGDLAGARLRAELLTHMNNVLTDIEDICTSIDAYNNERSAMTSDEEGLLPSKAASSDAEAQAKQRSLETLAQVDSRIELLISRIDFLDNRVGSLPTDEGSLGNESKDALQSRYQQVLCRWDDLKFRRERVSEELKEDRWLEVFEQVSEQVESMMESMERAILHCQGLVEQIKGMVRQKIAPDAPIDRDHLYSIFKSFEAKHKYYTPAVNKMLDMLENGIESRMTRNMDVISRHQSMNLKWDKLQDGLEHVDRELDGVERWLDILDDLRTPYLPKLPLKKQEPTGMAAKRAQNTNKPGWNSSATPSPVQQRQQQPRQQQHQRQQHASQVQRGRAPPSASLRSPSPSPGRSRTRSPNGDYYGYRPWSPANSNSGLSQCPSVSVTSPGIPGIPQELSPAATFIPRPVSVAGQNRMETPAPTGRAGSAMSGGSRSNASTPAMSRPGSSQYKPVFSPAGSISKLSSGVRSPVATPTPTPASGGARRTQLPMPSSSRPTSSQQQRSAFSPTPQSQRPQSRGFTSPVPTNYAASSRSSVSSVSSSSGRQRQLSANGQVHSGYGTQEGRLTSPRQSQYGYADDRAQYTSYSSRPGSASGLSMGRDSYQYASYDEPTSPSASSSSSYTSSIRQQQYQRSYSREQEFARVANASPVQMQIRRLGAGKYYFGGRVEDQTLVGGKLVLCRLMEYGRVGSGDDDSGVSSGGSHSGTDDGLSASGRSKIQMTRRNPSGLPTIHSAGSLAALQAEDDTYSGSKKKPRKVLVRVGGGWQDLDIFLLDHSKLATDSAVARGY